ncbi:MAG: hydroxymethylbilane synthase [bacterium]|nr:hydroxymethylbilane synthase [bacterium]
MEKIRIGTRGSKLALWQAYYIEDLLKEGGLETEIVIIETKGDKILDVSISKIGSKGVFTEEIEAQLKSGEIDIAVHSAKDMQSELPEGFSILAFTEREKINDVIVSHQKVDISDPDCKVVLGTSSTRRIATLKHYYPHIKTVDMRGNLQTRISKLERGDCDALVLAYAGVKRMGYDNMIQQELDESIFTPAVGQGSVAIEIYKTLDKSKSEKLKQLLNNEESETRLKAERAYLKRLQGGCSIPVFALANLSNNKISIKGGIISLNGQEKIVKELSGDISDPESLGTQLANDILAAGGDKILESIKNQIR